MNIHIFFLFVYFFIGSFMSGTESYYLLCVHMILYIVNSLRNKDLISPIFLFAVGVIVVNVGNISLINELHKGTITTYSYIIPECITTGAQIWCVSCTIIIMGYTLARNMSFPSIAFDLKQKHLKVIYVFLLALNIAVLFDSSFNVKRSLPIAFILNIFAILYYARLWTSQNNKTYAWYAISLFVLQTYSALATAFLRSELIYPLVSLLIGYFIGKKDLKFLFSYRMIPYLLILAVYAVIFSALDQKRSNFIGYFTEKSNTNPYAQSAAEKRAEKKDALLIRSANIAQLSNAVSLVRRNGFYNGRASAPLILALVPRILWPNKPTIQLGAWFALEIGQASLTKFGRANNSINMTVMGEMYLDFGWIGVVVGSLLLGVLIALLWNCTQFYTSDYNLAGTLFGGYLLLIMLLGIAADLQITITFMSFYVTFLIIKTIAKHVYLGSNQQVSAQKHAG